MEPTESLEQQWQHLLSFLPPEEQLEESAKTWGAIQRKRAVGSASELLRLALVYGFCGYSLRQTAAWATTAEVAALSDVALLKRLRNASDWLGYLLGLKLADRVEPAPATRTRLRLVDATSISAPGSTGSDWRVHLEFDLGAMAISKIQLTEASGAEALQRYAFEPQDLLVGDRGYALRPGLAHVVQAGAHFIVRLNWWTVPLQKPGGAEFDLLTALRGLPEAGAGSWELEIQAHPEQGIPAIPVRLIGIRKSEQAAEAARKKALRSSSKKGKKVQAKTLELASYMVVLTSTSATDLSPEEILEIYRFRWQIELVFKRLKSLLKLGELPAKDPKLAQSFLFSKLLAALLLEELTHGYLSFSPWGFRLRPHSTGFALAYSESPSPEPILRSAG
jgi:hypothetical protein